MATNFRMIKPQKSLRALLTMWFLLFSVVPIAFLTGYYLVKFEDAFNYEIKQRLIGNFREFEVMLGELEDYLLKYGSFHATDPALIYELSTNDIAKVRKRAEGWLVNYAASQISLFDRQGKLVVSLRKDENNKIESNLVLEKGDVYLADTLLQKFHDNKQFKFRDLHNKRGLELIVYTKVMSANNRLAGYIEETIYLNNAYLNNLKKRLNLDIVLYNSELNPIVSTNEDLLYYPQGLLKGSLELNNGDFFDMTNRGNSYGLHIKPLDSSKTIYLGLASSREEIKKVINEINKAVFSIGALVIFFIVIVMLSVSNIILKPLNNLVRAAKKMEEGEPTQLRIESETEIGLLTMSFNNMSKKVSQAQRDLKSKIEELERANRELRDTQAQLVQSAKMVSLGQLVAGVAHELNNPIGFIYNNMNHLKEYSDKLVKLVETEPNNLDQAKSQTDFDYIKKDMPKLIKSCEDGARRVRDIVLDLRNFSRADEKEEVEYDLEEGLENTLRLLAGEYKNRIQVHKDFSKIPKVKCFPNQINQAFMNILSNAIQAIPNRGDIWIKTTQTKSGVEIKIKDNGKGIPANIKDKIFDPFFSTKKIGQGTGLGLSITYGIIQRHNGEINVVSKEGEGTEFIIKLPGKLRT